MDKKNSRLKFSSLLLLPPIFFLLTVVAAAFDETNDAIVPAIFAFGDSSVDVGNNNHLESAMFKANYYPYGKDMLISDHAHSTGRFSNGKLTTDYGAEGLGFKHAQPGYLTSSFSAVNNNSFTTGANFASAGSGYYDQTALRYNAIPLSKQLEYFKAYKSKLVGVTGQKKAEEIVSGSVFLISTGNGDYVQNYYLNRSLRRRYNIDQYSTFIIGILAGVVERLHGDGARKIALTTLPPMGCLPAAINVHGRGDRTRCVARLNDDAQIHNRKLRKVVTDLREKLPDLKIAVLNTYDAILDLTNNATQHGFKESRRGCCATGGGGPTVLCKPNTKLLCRNVSEYVFFDGVHPTDLANKFISQAVMLDGIALLP